MTATPGSATNTSHRIGDHLNRVAAADVAAVLDQLPEHVDLSRSDHATDHQPLAATPTH